MVCIQFYHILLQTKRTTSLWTLRMRTSIHPVSITRFPSFRTQTLENLSHYLWKNRSLSNPDPGENLVSGNRVMETGCTILYYHILWYCYYHYSYYYHYYGSYYHLYVHTCISMCIPIYVYMYVYISIHIYIYMNIHIYIYICIHVYSYVYIYIYIRAYIYIYIYIYKLLGCRLLAGGVSAGDSRHRSRTGFWSASNFIIIWNFCNFIIICHFEVLVILLLYVISLLYVLYILKC